MLVQDSLQFGGRLPAEPQYAPRPNSGRYLRADPAVVDRPLSLGLATPGKNSPELTADTIRLEQDQWRALGKELNVEPQ